MVLSGNATPLISSLMPQQFGGSSPDSKPHRKITVTLAEMPPLEVRGEGDASGQ
jgi:hypothetical protein